MLSDTSERSMRVSTLVTVTVAPGKTAPVESVTVPLMSPEEICDCGKQSMQTKKTNAAKQTFRKFTGYPLLGLRPPVFHCERPPRPRLRRVHPSLQGGD